MDKLLAEAMLAELLVSRHAPGELQAIPPMTCENYAGEQEANPLMPNDASLDYRNDEHGDVRNRMGWNYRESAILAELAISAELLNAELLAALSTAEKEDECDHCWRHDPARLVHVDDDGNSQSRDLEQSLSLLLEACCLGTKAATSSLMMTAKDPLQVMESDLSKEI